MDSRGRTDGRTPTDILEAEGVRLLDEEHLREWPPKPERDGKQEGEAGRKPGPQKVSFLFFTAPWCEVSLETAPRFAELVARLARECSGRAEFAQVDADRAPLGTERLGVRSVPAVVTYAHGREISRHVGLASAAELTRLAGEAVEEAEAGGGQGGEQGGG